MIAPLITTIRTLTIMPIPGPETDNRAETLPFFPMVGAAIGAVFYASANLCNLVWSESPLITGLVVAFMSVMMTGALHLDGIADVADGFGGGKTKERILEIFKDSRHGTFGVVAIVLDLIARVLLVAWCMENGHLALIVIAAVFSRSSMAWACALLPYARSGSGTAESFISGKRPVLLLFTTAGTVAALLLGFGLVPQGTILLVAAVPVQFFLLYCMKKINGITGDCLGAVNEIGELGVLLTGCVLYG